MAQQSVTSTPVEIVELPEFSMYANTPVYKVDAVVGKGEDESPEVGKKRAFRLTNASPTVSGDLLKIQGNTTVDPTVVFGLRRQVIFPDASDQIYTVDQTRENKLLTIATDFYGNHRLWWVLAEVNRIVDPMMEVTIGTRLRIPLKSRLSQLDVTLR